METAIRVSLAGAILAVGPLPGATAQNLRLAELRRMMPFIQDMTGAIAAGDVDGDGDLDLYTGNGWISFLGVIPGPDRFYRNDGAGSFVSVDAALPSTFTGSRAVALGDVDGDGDLDAFLGVQGQNRLGLYDGAGGFVDATAQLPAALDETSDVALGDLDGDGDLDVFVGNHGSSPFPTRLYLNDGAGVFADASSMLPVQILPVNAVALGDLDGDGDLDVFLGGGISNKVYLNDGFARFAASPNGAPSFGAAVDVALGDVDGDSDLDAFLATNEYTYFKNYRLLRNLGTGVFVDASTSLPSTEGISSAVALGDVDGDGDLDALVTNSNAPNRLFLNGGSGGFSHAAGLLPPFASTDAYTLDVVLEDLDGDGDLDALFGTAWSLNGAGGQERLYLNDGSGAFEDVTGPFAGTAYETLAVAVGDVDGDGDLDVLLGNDGKNRLLRNDGTGVSGTSSGQEFLPASVSYSVTFGDVDGDGDLDALVGNDGSSLLYLNDASGTFAIQAFAAGTVRAAALADVDGDGDPDALLGGPGQNRLFRNDGPGGFVEVTAQIPPVDDDTHALAVGDVDGDGDLDVVVGNTGENRVLLNDGNGAFVEAAVPLPADTDRTQALALGDVDGDGDLDLLAGNGPQFPAYAAQSRLYLNDGSGVFADATAAQMPAILGNTRAVALGDLDEDGDLDAFLGNAGGYFASGGTGQQNQVYANDGSGVFVLSTATLPAIGDATRAVALGDLDGDGDLDAFVGNTGPTSGEERLLYNLRRQLSWRAVPGVGKPLLLDLQGPPLGGCVLAFSTGAGSLPVPTLGTLRLDPSGIHLAWLSLLDAQGRASKTYSVPSDPAILGATVYWQALVTSPARLTNLEITTLTSL